MNVGETKLGYTITELVGQGGFGAVYKAVKKNKALETVRALKHISLPSRKEWTDVYNSMGNDIAKTDEYFDAVLQEILNEIRILADLTNKGVKNVVWYYENEIEDTPSPKHYDIYLLMEFLTPFTSFIENNKIKVSDVIKVGMDILSALVECHKRKIIHRDIKTDNIFVSEDGDYKLGDFGVSKKLSDRSRATSMKGTPNYIAPEVYLGQEYDETVDIYSLGIVLYRLLNYNRNPFMPAYPTNYNSEDEDKSFELRMKGEKPSYPTFASGELGDVVLKAISSKEDRYKSATEFKEALEKASKSLSKDELDKVVLENQLSGVDFSTFGSKNEMTQMASNNQSSILNVSFGNSQANSMNLSNSFSINNGNNNINKKKLLIPIIAAFCVIAGIGSFLALKGGKGNNGKFVKENGITKFVKKGGDYAQNEWVFYNDDEYYFNGRQSLVTNDVVEYNGKKYYVNVDGAKIYNNWYKTSDGKEYYLDENGEPYKNTAKTINDEVFFFNDNGEKVINDWFNYENDYYYLDNDGKMVVEQFKNIGPDWFFLGKDGKMLKNTFYDYDGETYYFDINGFMKKNSLVQVDSGIYYAESSGAIKKNGWCSNNLYYASSDGKILISTTTPDGVKVDNTGRRVDESANRNTQSTKNNSTSNNNNNNNNTNFNNSVNYSGELSIKNGNVVWGEHLRYSENVDLEDYGETGVGKLTVDITLLKDDGTQEVEDFNANLEKIFNDACQRAEVELPYKYFELDKTTMSTANDKQLVVVITGQIKYTDNTEEKIRYKIMLDREHGSVTYEKVR